MRKEATATEIFFINKFKATQDEINEWGEKFGNWSVYHYLMNGPNENYNDFLTNGLEDATGFDRVKLDIFIDVVSEVLAEQDIYIEEMDVKIGRAEQLIEAEGLSGYGLEEIAKRAGIKLVDTLTDPNSL